jgi:DNA (cytosine-5)-methyltransferase 1
VDTTKTITHIGLCAGYGGIELGLARVLPTLRSVALCEIEAFPIANLVAKMEAGLLESAPIWTDLKTFPWESFRDRVDILTGGYPCQPFSATGKRAGKEDPRHLWPWIADGIRILRPKVCFFENVEGHISLGLSSVISDLEELGYQVSWGIFSAAEVGAPHQRKRVFILAHSIHGGRGQEWLLGRMEGIRDKQENNPSTTAKSNSQLAHSSSHGHDGWPIQDGVCGRSVSQLPQPLQGGCAEVRSEVEGCCDNACELADTKDQYGRHTIRPEAQDTKSALRCQYLWPSRPSEPQHGWEPPRVAGNSKCVLLPAAGEHGAVDEESGIPADGEGSEPSQADSDASLARSGEAMANTGISGSDRRSDGSSGRTRQSGEVSVDAAECGGQSNGLRQAQPSLGGNSDGPADWLDYAELCVSCDNRTDELRLLGNGVVPATAERAFRTLIKKLL